MYEITPLSENESRKYIVQGIRNLLPYHVRGETFYSETEEWKRKDYGWHNPRFAPEYRKHCLDGGAYESKPSDDLYFFMVQAYEQITGKEPPINHQLNKLWKMRLYRATEEWDECNRKAVSNLFSRCTCLREEWRIKDAAMAVLSEDFKILSGTEMKN